MSLALDTLLSIAEWRASKVGICVSGSCWKLPGNCLEITWSLLPPSSGEPSAYARHEQRARRLQAWIVSMVAHLT
eukprot:6190763-Pleurochrysis_carterae.AAC.1